ncbi:MAG: DUF255 domain-containing protein [Planctomycetota bacterium]
MSLIEWRPWSEEAFAEARERDCPVLLFLTASWCRWCRSMQTETFSHPEVIGAVQENFVAVHVDKDKRPDIDERFNMGGWPTVAFLSSDGEVITGGTYFGPDELLLVLRRVSAYYHEEKDFIAVTLDRLVENEEAERREREQRTGRLAPAIVTNVLGAIVEGFDPEYGGFGLGQKFPHHEAIDFALLKYVRTRDPRIGHIVQTTLTAMMQGKLHDGEEGGFYRFCGTRDWREPHTEKLLETNAGLLRNYLEAAQVFQSGEYRRTAERIADYITTTLLDREKGRLFGSQDADDSYHACLLSERRKRSPPKVDRTVYVNSAACGVSSLLKAGTVLERDDLTQCALECLQFLLENCYSEGRGMYHYFDGSRHMLGLLTDQITMARALVHAIHYTGNMRYRVVLEDLIETIVKKQSASHGGFYDLPEDSASFGSLRRRNRSILENAIMAEVLIRNYYLTLNETRLELAKRTLEAFANDYQAFGYFTATYGRAVDLYFNVPLHVVIIGRGADPRRVAMVRTAAATYMPSKIVMALDPEVDVDLVQRFGFPSRPEPVAYVCLGRHSVAEVTEPERLANVMEAGDREH